MTEHTISTLLSSIIGKQSSRIPASTPLCRLRAMEAGELRATFKLTPAAAGRLAAALELGRHASGETLVRGTRLHTSAQVYQHFVGRLRDLKVEQFWSVHLDGKHRVQHEHLISQGTLTSSPVHPREVFSPAIKEAAAAIILVHNHPSGDPSPSADDIEITGRLSTVGDTVGIRILDHVIVGDAAYKSLADAGLLSRW